MANEITYTGKSDLYLAATLNQMLWRQIVDRSSMRALMTNMGLANGTGSTVSKIGQVKYDDPMTAANVDEVTAVAATDLTTANVTITVARQALTRVVSDMYELVGGSRPGLLDLAADMANAAALRTCDMGTALFTGLSGVVGTTATDLTVDDIVDAHYTLIQSRVPGQLSAVLAPIQLTDFLDSLRAESGSAQWNPATEAIQSAQGGAGWGKAGQWRGIDFYSSDSVTTVGADKIGAMFGPGTFGYREMNVGELARIAGPGSFASVAPDGSSVFVEFERQAGEALTKIVGNLYFGCSELEDARGVRVRSSAT